MRHQFKSLFYIFNCYSDQIKGFNLISIQNFFFTFFARNFVKTVFSYKVKVSDESMINKLFYKQICRRNYCI